MSEMHLYPFFCHLPKVEQFGMGSSMKNLSFERAGKGNRRVYSDHLRKEMDEVRNVLTLWFSLQSCYFDACWSSSKSGSSSSTISGLMSSRHDFPFCGVMLLCKIVS